MAQNVTVAGASYSDVPSVVLPKTGGGSAQFDDTTIASNAASASDITSGKLAFVNGELVTGTASGGGGGGLEYETGTFTPAGDVNRPTINFSKTHSTPPAYICISDASGTGNLSTYTGYYWTYTNCMQFFGAGYPINNTDTRNCVISLLRRTTGSNAPSAQSIQPTYDITNPGSSSTSYARYFVDESWFKPYFNNNSVMLKSGRTYKWIAVWAPTS